MRHGWSWLWMCMCVWSSATAHAESGSTLAAEGIVVGAGTSVDNLTVFPLFATRETDLGEITTLEEALARKEAEVRELGSGEVSRLVIRNRGKRAIYVLAGTLVKGGNQDRQIGQDFVIESKRSVPVDAFCVEQGRWESKRDGKTTGGKFVATKALATSDVRRAAQYGRDQGEVWNKVSKINETHKKSTASGTLMATVDAGDVGAHKKELVRKIEQALDSASSDKPLVGLAYAVGGAMRSARWFANGKVFKLFRESLVQAAALDELTARAGGVTAAAPAKAADVDSFVSDVEAARRVERRDTQAANANEYKESARGFGSKTRLKNRPDVSLSSDYVVKEEQLETKPRVERPSDALPSRLVPSRPLR
jgi:hypothetical protein